MGTASVLEILPALLSATMLSWLVIFIYIRYEQVAAPKAKDSFLPLSTKECKIQYIIVDDEEVNMSAVDKDNWIYTCTPAVNASACSFSIWYV